jgi:IS30 family transposase
MAKVTSAQAKEVQLSVNTYPRPMFCGKCSNDIFKSEIDSLALAHPERVYSFFNL